MSASDQQHADEIMTKENEQKHRVQLDFSEAAFKELMELRVLSGASTNAKVFRNALAVYKWYLETKISGSDIILEHQNGKSEKINFIFSK